MYLHVKTFMLFGLLNNFYANEDVIEYRVASVTHKVRTHVSDAKRAGLFMPRCIAVGPIVGYDNCAAGWASVLGGEACLVKTEVVNDNPLIFLNYRYAPRTTVRFITSNTTRNAHASIIWQERYT